MFWIGLVTGLILGGALGTLLMCIVISARGEKE